MWYKSTTCIKKLHKCKIKFKRIWIAWGILLFEYVWYNMMSTWEKCNIRRVTHFLVRPYKQKVTTYSIRDDYVIRIRIWHSYIEYAITVSGVKWGSIYDIIIVSAYYSYNMNMFTYEFIVPTHLLTKLLHYTFIWCRQVVVVGWSERMLERISMTPWSTVQCNLCSPAVINA